MGEEIVIACSGCTVARLTRYEAADEPRIEGRDAGLLTVPDDFTKPVPNDFLESIYR